MRSESSERRQPAQQSSAARLRAQVRALTARMRRVSRVFSEAEVKLAEHEARSSATTEDAATS